MIWSPFLSVLNLLLFMWGAVVKSFSCGWTWVLFSCLKSGFKPILGLKGSKYSFKVSPLLLYCHFFSICMDTVFHFFHLLPCCLSFYSGYCVTTHSPRRLMWAYPCICHLSIHPETVLPSIMPVRTHVRTPTVTWHVVLWLLAGTYICLWCHIGDVR